MIPRYFRLMFVLYSILIIIIIPPIHISSSLCESIKLINKKQKSNILIWIVNHIPQIICYINYRIRFIWVELQKIFVVEIIKWSIPNVCPFNWFTYLDTWINSIASRCEAYLDLHFDLIWNDILTEIFTRFHIVLIKLKIIRWYAVF